MLLMKLILKLGKPITVSFLTGLLASRIERFCCLPYSMNISKLALVFHKSPYQAVFKYLSSIGVLSYQINLSQIASLVYIPFLTETTTNHIGGETGRHWEIRLKELKHNIKTPNMRNVFLILSFMTTMK